MGFSAEPRCAFVDSLIPCLCGVLGVAIADAEVRPLAASLVLVVGAAALGPLLNLDADASLCDASLLLPSSWSARCRGVARPTSCNRALPRSSIRGFLPEDDTFASLAASVPFHHSLKRFHVSRSFSCSALMLLRCASSSLLRARSASTSARTEERDCSALLSLMVAMAS